MLYVMDHAQPILDEEGNVESVDGFMLNVTDRHSLEQQVIQTEELRTLSEISERLAHEIRNPLVAAGGFARRMLNTLSDEDPQSGEGADHHPGSRATGKNPGKDRGLSTAV